MESKKLELIELALGKVDELIYDYDINVGLEYEIIKHEIYNNADRVLEVAKKLGLSEEATATVMLAVALNNIFNFIWVPTDSVEVNKITEAMKMLGYEPVVGERERELAEMLTRTEDWECAENFAQSNNLEFIVIDASERLIFKPARARRQNI